MRTGDYPWIGIDKVIIWNETFLNICLVVD